MAKKRKTYDDDDGRVVANMNIDGMPWYIREHRSRNQRPSEGSDLYLSKEEERALVWGSIKAGLLIAGIFILGAFLFILFCLYVWF